MQKAKMANVARRREQTQDEHAVATESEFLSNFKAAISRITGP